MMTGQYKRLNQGRWFSRVFLFAAFLLPLLVAGVVAAGGNDFRVDNLTVELLDAPQGIDVALPTFSWKLFAKTNGEKQSAWQLVVTTSGKEKKNVWDSGKVVSDCQTFVPFGGQPLAPRTGYEVVLTVWNKDGSQSATTKSTFSTGLFPTAAEPNPWQAKWIGYEQAQKPKDLPSLAKSSWIAWQKGTAVPTGLSVYRYAFNIENPAGLEKATAAFAGDNSSRAFLNGKEYSKGQSFKAASLNNILPLLKKGKNVFAIEANNIGEGPNPAGVVGVITLKYRNGKSVEYVTDSKWKAKQGSNPDWFAIDFDDSAWSAASIVAPCGQGPWGEVQVVMSATNELSARYLARQVKLENKKVCRAVAYLVGLGYYELRLDGTKVGDHVLDPILTEFNKRVAYNTYDVTDRLIAGKELNISVVLGNGRYYPPRKTEPLNTTNYGYPKLLFQLEIEYADGTVQKVVSDEAWQVSVNGPIEANNDYDGEVYNATKTLAPNTATYLEKGKNGKMFSVATPNKVQIVAAPQGQVVAQMMPPMRVNMELAAKSVQEVRPGVWIYDFGQNFVGWVRLKVKGNRGQKVNLRFAETLIPDGPDKGLLYMANLRGAKCHDIYCLAGDKEGEIYEPRFSYHGFRFVELTGYPGTPDLKTLTGCVVNTDLKVTGSFECNNPTVTRFYKNVEWGTRGNYLSIPTDCPQRDERQGWQGDRAAGSKGEMFIFNNVTLYRKWMQDIADTQRPDGNVSDVAPSYWKLYGTNVTWPSAQVFIPQSLYLMFGDKTAIRRHYDCRKNWLDHLYTFVKSDGTIDKDNYGDWCVPPESQELIHSKDPKRITNKGVLATSYMIYDLRLSAQYAEMLGKKSDVTYFTSRADSMQEAFNTVFYNPKEGKYDNGTQTSSVLPLAYGLVPKGEEKKVFQTLVNNIENVTDRHIGTGLIGAQWINRVLTDHGRIDLAWGFASATSYPSWGYMLKKGATTVWELWNGDTANPAMNSGNHVMLVGDLVIWLYEDLAGIKADCKNPGFKRVLMFPNVTAGLTSVKAKYDSVRGIVGSEWTYSPEKKSFKWTIVVPVNSTALVGVPTTDATSVRCNVPGFDSLEKKPENGRVVFEIPSGVWTFTSTL